MFNGPVHEISLLISYGQKPPRKAHADVSSEARGLNFDICVATIDVMNFIITIFVVKLIFPSAL